jgi:hypothetical protein
MERTVKALTADRSAEPGDQPPPHVPPAESAGGTAPGRSIRRPMMPGMETLFAAVWFAVGWGAGLRQLSDNSFLWHLKTGHWILDHGLPTGDIFSFTHPGSAWVPQSWLAEVLYASLDRLTGPVGIRLLDATVGALVAYYSYKLAKRLQRDRMAAAFLVLPALLASCQLWVERPLFLGILAMLALIWMVEVPESWVGRHSSVLIPVLLWLWVNIHGTFALGLVYLGLHIAGRWLDGAPPWRDRERRLLQASAAGFLLCFLNPYGFSLVVFPVELLMRGEVLADVLEWASPSFREPVGMAFAAWIVVVIGVFALSRNRPSRRDVVVAIPFLLLGLWALRNVALAPLVGLPIAARLLVASRVRPVDRSRLNGLILAIVSLAVVAWTGRALAQPDFDLRQYPVKAMQVTERQGLLGRRLLTSDRWAAYVIHTYWPRQKIFIDDRFDMYPPSFIDSYAVLLNGDPDWRSVLDRNRIEVVVWEREYVLSQLLSVDPGWREIYQDDRARIFIRR